MLAHILALAWKELLALVRDKRSRFVLVGPPIIQLLVFGFAASFDLNQAPMAIYDEDGGGPARELIARFAGSRNFKIVRHIGRDAQVAPLIDNREVLLVLHIGQGFSADVLSGRGGDIQLILDGRNSNTAMTAANYVRSILIDYNGAWAAAHGQAGAPARLSIRPWYNRESRSPGGSLSRGSSAC